MIFRSDSNGEDLEGFAGAGLFESVPAEENQKLILSYATVKLVRDGEYRKRLLKKIGDVRTTEFVILYSHYIVISDTLILQ